MDVCVACLAGGIDPAPDATTMVLGTGYCNDHGVQAYLMTMSPGMARRAMMVQSQVLPTPGVPAVRDVPVRPGSLGA